MSRWNNTAEDSASVVGHYTVWTGRHGRAMLVPYYHGEANEQSAAQRAEAAATGFRRETGLGYSGKLVNRKGSTLTTRVYQPPKQQKGVLDCTRATADTPRWWPLLACF